MGSHSSSFAAGQHLVSGVYSNGSLCEYAQTTHDGGNNGLGNSNQACNTSIRLKDLQHGGAKHSLAMFSAAEYEAIELAADGLMASLTAANGDVTHTPTPLRGSDPKIDFGTRKDFMNPNVGRKPNNLGIGAREDLRHSSVVTTTAHSELGMRTGLATLCAEAKDQVT